MDTQSYLTEDESDFIPERDESNNNIKYCNDNMDGNELEFPDLESEKDFVEENDYLGTSCVFSLVEEPSFQSGLIDELQDKLTVLESNFYESDKKCQELLDENEKLTSHLNNQQQRFVKLQKKLKYIEDNQEVFGKLKQAYLNVKYNEAAGRSLVEIEEKGCQVMVENFNATVPSTDCNKCDKKIIVKVSDIEEIQKSISNIKFLVATRNKTQNTTSSSEYEDLIKCKDAEIQQLNNKVALITKNGISKENASLKKIILKLEKRRRELEIQNNLQNLPSPLSECEKNIVQKIITKYTRKVDSKCAKSIRSKSCETHSTTSRQKIELGSGERSCIKKTAEEIVSQNKRILPKSNLVLANFSKKDEKHVSSINSKSDFFGNEKIPGVRDLLCKSTSQIIP